MNGSARVSRSTSEPAKATRPSRIPIASTQPNPDAPASVAIRPVMSMSSGTGQPDRVREQCRQPVPIEPGPDPERQRDPGLRRAQVTDRQRPGPDPRRAAARERVGGAGRPDGQRLASATGIPASIARTAAASSAGSVFPAPVAATTIPSAPAATAASSSAPSIATVAVMRWTRSAARVVATWRGAARPQHPDLVRRPPARATRRSGSRTCQRRRVHLEHVVGRLDRAGEADDDAGAAQPPGRRDPDGVAEVGRTIEAGRIRRPHRAGHDDRLRPLEDEIPAEARLLDRVGALDDDRAVDRRIGQRRPQRVGDLEQDREREVAGRRPAEIDRHDLGDLVETGRPGEDRGPVERRDVAAGDRIEGRADRPAREHDDDARHDDPQSRSVGSVGPA